MILLIFKNLTIMKKHEPFKWLGEFISTVMACTKLTKSIILTNARMGADTYASLKKGAICESVSMPGF